MHREILAIALYIVNLKINYCDTLRLLVQDQSVVTTMGTNHIRLNAVLMATVTIVLASVVLQSHAQSESICKYV